MTEAERIERAAEAVYREFENRPQYARLQMNSVMAEELARAAITAYLGGDVVVPREPTTVQSNAGVDADDLRTGYETVKHIYRAMISAAPHGIGG